MKKNNSYLPVIISISVLIGLMAGRLLFSEYSFKLKNPTAAEKLSLVMYLIQNNYVDSINTDLVTEKTITYMLKQLDPHSAYLNPIMSEQSKNEIEGKFKGIGIQFNVRQDTAMVVDVIKNSPSEKVGLKPGDRIVKVNDSEVIGYNVTNTLSERIKKQESGKVKLKIKRPGVDSLIDIDVNKEYIPLKSVDIAYMLDKQTGYLRITSFSRNTYDEFVKQVKKLKKNNMKNLIIDLRDNGGGLLETAEMIIDEFLPEKTLILYTQGRNRHREDYYATSNYLMNNINVAILINEYTASAAELMAGSLQDNDRAIIVGRRSFGKGLVQEEFSFKDGSSVLLTVARYYTPTGRCIQKPYKQGDMNYDDEVLYRYISGELTEKDSIKIDNLPVYTTPKGKKVYGGGGIIPDIFVPIKDEYDDTYLQLLSFGIINSFAIDFVDKNRHELKKTKNTNQLLNYLKQKNITEEFAKYTTDIYSINMYDKIKKDKDNKIFEVLSLLIVRYTKGFDEYIKLKNTSDRDVRAAIEVLEK